LRTTPTLTRMSKMDVMVLTCVVTATHPKSLGHLLSANAPLMTQVTRSLLLMNADASSVFAIMD
jgi:hypothetical protein